MLPLYLILLFNVVMAKQNVINLPQGQIRGVAHHGYVSFTGIPYATVAGPMGRFKGAGLAPVWSDIRNSTTSTCSSVSEAEACLQLDVHVPSAIDGNWPVLVWVTGGSGPYNPGILVRQGIIVIIVHHRYGPLGFLCQGDEKIPGNAGVKDATLALRWVRDNIVAFRGNPSKVIIAGHSFGAAMVDAIMLSSMADGLYHGAILQSGTALCPWAFNYDAEDRANLLDTIFTEDLEESLLGTKIEELLDETYKLNVPYFPFGICMEKPLKTEERFLSEAPYDLLSNKKVNSVPMIIGYNDNEAYIFASILREANVLQRARGDKRFLLPDELKFINNTERKQVARQIGDFYFKNNVTMDTVLAYHRDAYFSAHIHRSVRLRSTLSPVYYYQFSYHGDVGIQPEQGVEKVGAAHSDELAYLFNDVNLDGDDGVVQKRMVKLWTNFVKYLNPTPVGSHSTWEATQADTFRLLDINKDLKMMNYPNARASHMWDEIHDKFYYIRNRIAN